MHNYVQKINKFGISFYVYKGSLKVAKQLYQRSLISSNMLQNRINADRNYVYKTTKGLIKPVLDKYETENSQLTEKFQKIVWVMWMQGFEKAPDIVRYCITSIRKNSGYSEVRLITKQNIGNFIDIPTEVSAKLSSGLISNALYSDYVRFKILKKFGGVWLDATCYCTNHLPEYLEDVAWSSPKGMEQFDYKGISSGQFPYISEWVSYYVSSVPNGLFVRFMSDALEYYIVSGFPLLDYFLVFFLAKIARESLPEVQAEYAEIPENNTKCEQLWPKLVEKTGKSDGVRIVSDWIQSNSHTQVYKLSYRRFDSLQQSKNINSFLGKLGKNEIN